MGSAIVGIPPARLRLNPEPRTPADPLTDSLSHSLRALMPADREACLALDAAALGGLWTAGQWDTELAAPGRPGVGLWEGEALVAMASGWLILEELHITLVAVDPRCRRRGLGRRVLEALLDQARAAGAQHATLEVAAPNDAARALYGGAGFREAGVRRGYYRNGDDALIQWFKLKP